MNTLEEIVARTREEVARRKAATPLAELGEPRPRREFLEALRSPGLSVIAEHKRASPSAGPIREDLQLSEIVAAYERGGAAALSVLTEGPSFGGSLEDLAAAREASALPILRKDFIVDPYQVHESAAWGADAILLIVAALAEHELAALHELATGIGLDVLVEVHDGRELEVALRAGAPLVGINNRDLTTLAVDTGRALQLSERVPTPCTVVAESGYATREQLDELERAGIDAVLIGEALMRASDLEAAIRGLR